MRPQMPPSVYATRTRCDRDSSGRSWSAPEVSPVADFVVRRARGGGVVEVRYFGGANDDGVSIAVPWASGMRGSWLIPGRAARCSRHLLARWQTELRQIELRQVQDDRRDGERMSAGRHRSLWSWRDGRPVAWLTGGQGLACVQSVQPKFLPTRAAGGVRKRAP